MEPQAQSRINRLRTRISRRPLAACLIALFVGLAIAGVLGASAVDEKSVEIEGLNADLAAASEAQTEAEGDRDKAEEIAADVTARKDEIIGRAQDRAKELVGGAKDELAKTQEQLAEVKGELSSTQSELTDVQASLDDAEETQQMSSFGNGIWEAGTDFIPGTYRAPGGSTCYWAKLDSADTFDIASNSVGSGPQVATIDSAYFETEGCGKWELSE